MRAFFRTHILKVIFACILLVLLGVIVSPIWIGHSIDSANSSADSPIVPMLVIMVMCVIMGFGYWRLPEGGRKWIKKHGMQITTSIVLLSLLTTYWSDISKMSGAIWNWGYFTGWGLRVWKGICLIAFAVLALSTYTLVTKPKKMVGPVGFWSIAFVIIGGIFLLGTVFWNEVAKDWVHETITTDPASRVRAKHVSEPRFLQKERYQLEMHVPGEPEKRVWVMQIERNQPFLLQSIGSALILSSVSDFPTNNINGEYQDANGGTGTWELTLDASSSVWEGQLNTFPITLFKSH